MPIRYANLSSGEASALNPQHHMMFPSAAIEEEQDGHYERHAQRAALTTGPIYASGTMPPMHRFPHDQDDIQTQQVQYAKLQQLLPTANEFPIAMQRIQDFHSRQQQDQPQQLGEGDIQEPQPRLQDQVNTQKYTPELPSDRQTIRAARTQSTEVLIPLRQWIQNEPAKNHHNDSGNGDRAGIMDYKKPLLRKITVAYGIAELISRLNNNTSSISKNVSCNSNVACNLDNFAVRVSTNYVSSMNSYHGAGITFANGNGSAMPSSPDVIEGVDMISPFSSLRFAAPIFIDSFNCGDETEEAMGKCLEVNIESFNEASQSSMPVENCNHIKTHEADNTDDELAQMAALVHFDGSDEVFESAQSGLKEGGAKIVDSCGTKHAKAATEHNNEHDELAQMGALIHFDGRDEISELVNSESNIVGGHDQVNKLNQKKQLETKEAKVTAHKSDESWLCHLFGALLYEMFTSSTPFHMQNDQKSFLFNNQHSNMNDNADIELEPSRKRSTFANLFSSKDNINSDGPHFSTESSRNELTQKLQEKYIPLKQMGYPSSLSTLVKNLLECACDEFRPQDAYPSLTNATMDLHLLIEDPNRFLFDHFISTQVPASLPIRKDKLYGREVEASMMTDAFCRASSTGNEALFVAGFSGSGKSRLVDSVTRKVEDVAGGYVISKKFDEISQEKPLSVVISAFNELCLVIREKTTPHDIDAFVSELMSVFGSHLSTLVRVLPNITVLCPQLMQVFNGNYQRAELTFGAACYILQLFVRVVSSKSRPVMLCLDDLQWADDASLDMVHTILSGRKGSSCVFFFVGSFRDNEVQSNHAIFRFMEKLNYCNIPTTNMRLDGISKEDLCSMISDALGIFPRLCQKLSDIVFQKTKGNPFFALTFLNSLVDRGLLHYSLRDRKWVWSDDAISAEEITDNVCHLLTSKMITLSTEQQLALKVASCFGIKIYTKAVQYMSAIFQHSSFQQELDQAVREGFIDKSDSGYKFVHDKVREAAYSLIDVQERRQFHYSIGMDLYKTSKGHAIGDLIFVIANQINSGLPSLEFVPDNQRIDIVELNCAAASEAMNGSSFSAAYSLANAAVNVLPEEHWDAHYELSRKIYLLFGNAAYACGNIEEATVALDMVLSKGQCLEDKIDAYSSKISMLRAQQEANEAYNMCLDVLLQFGEDIPTSVAQKSLIVMAGEIQSDLSNMTDDSLFGVREMESKSHYFIMQLYSQICFAAYFVRPNMVLFFACRMIKLSLKRGFCKYTAMGFVQFGMVLGGKMINDVQGGYRVGKLALLLLKRFDATDQIPIVYLAYYGFIAVHIEPFQSCADMLRRGFEIGMTTGDTSAAFFNGAQYIQKAYFSGANLLYLKEESAQQLTLIDKYSQSTAKMYTKLLHETICITINKDDAPEFDNFSYVDEFSDSLIFNRAVQNFWLGRYERCIYYAEKASNLAAIGKLKSIMVHFYHGISWIKRKCRRTDVQKKVIMKSIEEIRAAAVESKWNYQNKLHLLEAELYSSQQKKDQAKMAYNAAIEYARASNFNHEQGLACELAGFHYKRLKEFETALSFFSQAKECYVKWGSQTKVGYITHHISILPVSLEGSDAL